MQSAMIKLRVLSLTINLPMKITCNIKRINKENAIPNKMSRINSNGVYSEVTTSLATDQLLIGKISIADKYIVKKNTINTL